MNKLSLSPGKNISGVSIFVLVFMLVFGITFALLVGNVLVENEAPVLMSIAFSIFIVFWIGTVLYMLIYHIKNYSGKKSLPLIEIEIENENSLISDPVKKIRELDALKKDGLISDTEFEIKRKQILDQKW